MNSKLVGIIILVVVIGGASAYFLTKDNSIDTISTSSITQNDKVGLVINTIDPPKSIEDFEQVYHIAASSGIGRTNLYVYWDQLEPEKGNFDWRMTDLSLIHI